ncbi:hypothetical protein GWK48_05380 [Metallosphaera tengchongensis]|uniref:Uncharacterized protein n=1 Tax=Metallosphaera tengchongensis TaxID=1532350 RepID=A0A6N0NUW7_9CREN|nr:hypothetical protein [Metallosphaera tengchongensis]QKQ98989.1 hypothetical protein GWK48_05380 [Metallosphaera tengchongensis]
MIDYNLEYFCRIMVLILDENYKYYSIKERLVLALMEEDWEDIEEEDWEDIEEEDWEEDWEEEDEW